MADNFFDEQLDQSETKARLVQKYFFAWATIVGSTAEKFGNGRIAYIDLFAGPGRYKDGAASTPLLVLEHALKSPRLSKTLVTYFNDADRSHSASLQAEINKLQGIGNLQHKPQVSCGEIGADAEKFFNETRLIPSFTFFDPFGYKGLSLKIINGVIKDWGCDCIFFFNYSRINAGLSNPLVKPHMDALFGEQRADELRTRIEGKSPDARIALILEELSQAIKEMGGKFVLPFRFKRGKRMTHSLVFVSKSFKGYETMKDIMATESSSEDQGVPSFTYSPADASTPLLFSLSQPFDALKEALPLKYAGKTITMRQLYESHSVDTPYLSKHYKQALRELEAEGLITANPSVDHRRKNTFADHVSVTFREG